MEGKLLGLLTLLMTILCGVLFSHGAYDDSVYQDWKQTHGFDWDETEDIYRRIVFMTNVKIIEEHNADNSQTYKMGLNQFTAFTQEEFESRYLGAQLPADFHPLVGDEGISVPNDVDWVSQGKVSPIKNQGACGSCWAFSATGVMESWSLFNGKAVSLSEQQLVDCSRSYGNQGCNGGWPSSALNYVKDKGITSESDYPYKAHTNSCVKNGGDFHIAGYSSYSGCTNLANALASHPVSVTVDARNWPHYASGVFTNCGSQIDHAVLAVGMTSSYWKIKNSWGTSWGESGYIRIGSGNTCGICHYPGIYPY